jgi:hypothetical protein
MLGNVVATLKSHVDLFWLGRFDIDKKRTGKIGTFSRVKRFYERS